MFRSIIRDCLAVLLVLLAAVMPGIVTAAEDDHGATETQQQAHHGGHHQHRRGPKTIHLENAENAVITLWNPDLSTRSLQAENGIITVPNTGINSYHAVVAESVIGDKVETLIRYEYLRGRPADDSPAKLAAAAKTRFEIVPDPIPREHYHYHSDQTWGFILLFDGQPLADAKVLLQTDHGSQTEGVTDQAGRVSLHIPDDFPDIQPGERDKRSADLRVSAETQVDNIHYRTVLSADYRINPAHWQSFGWGIAVAGLGFLVGGFIGRVKNQNKQENYQ
ncbi:MAG: hypothetical protein QNJ78_14970 [Gammaproteobacteria bacterium]|nr:hypothetical protein [Gammaproteobacteria bacterium]